MTDVTVAATGEGSVRVDVPVPSRWTVQEAVVLLKCVDDDGDDSWYYVKSPGVTDEELIGSLTVRLDIARAETRALYEP